MVNTESDTFSKEVWTPLPPGLLFLSWRFVCRYLILSCKHIIIILICKENNQSPDFILKLHLTVRHLEGVPLWLAAESQHCWNHWISLKRIKGWLNFVKSLSITAKRNGAENCFCSITGEHSRTKPWTTGLPNYVFSPKLCVKSHFWNVDKNSKT